MTRHKLRKLTASHTPIKGDVSDLQGLNLEYLDVSDSGIAGLIRNVISPKLVTETATALAFPPQVSRLPWYREHANFGCSRYGCSRCPPHYVVSRSVLDALYRVQKCLIDALSVLFQVLLHVARSRITGSLDENMVARDNTRNLQSLDLSSMDHAPQPTPFGLFEGGRNNVTVGDGIGA